MSTKSMFRGGVLTYYDPAKKNLVTRREQRYWFHDDFDVATSIPAAASRANGNAWVKKITGSAPPTVAYTADGSGGIIQCATTAASEAQDATIYWDDQRCIDLDRAVVFQAYARLTVLPTSNNIAHLGLADDYAAGFVGTTYNVGFTIAASGVVSTNIDDNVTPVATAAGVTMNVNDWYAFRIEIFSKTNIRWFINGAVVGVAGSYAATAGANSTIQPFCGIGKASGTGVGTLQIDSVDIWQD